jgi:hypothetical protein
LNGEAGLRRALVAREVLVFEAKHVQLQAFRQIFRAARRGDLSNPARPRRPARTVINAGLLHHAMGQDPPT